MEIFNHLENFNDNNEYWGLDGLLWNWPSLLESKEKVSQHINTEFAMEGVGVRKYKVNKCMEFKALSESIKTWFSDKDTLLRPTEDRVQVIKDWAKVYQQAVVAYYGIYKVSIPSDNEEEEERAIDYPPGPWLLFSKIFFEAFISAQNLIKAKALAAVLPPIQPNNANLPQPAQPPQRRAPRVGFPVNHEFDINQEEDKRDDNRPQERQRPRQVSFDLFEDRRDRNRGRDRNNNNNLYSLLS